MGLSRKQLAGLGLGLTMGGTVAESLDSDRAGFDDKLGRALRIGGGALTQLSAGETEVKKTAAAGALRTIATALNEYADELDADAEG